MVSPMSRVNSLVSADIGNYLTNKETWSSILYNVKAYGAEGDGVTDDASAFNSAVSALKTAGGGILRIPPGNYFLGGPITITDTNIRIEGSGVQSTKLFFSTTDGFLYSTTNQFSNCFEAVEFSIIALTTATKTGISVSFPSNAGSSWRNCYIENVTFAGSPSIAAYNDGTNNSQVTVQKWLTSLYMNNCAVTIVKDIVVRSGISHLMSTGIWVDGYTVDVLLKGNRIYAADTGIKKTGFGEGIQIEDTMCINVNYGITLNQGAVSASGVYASIHSCHINYEVAGIIANQQPQVAISNCLIYKQGSGVGTDISLTECDRSRIFDNTLIVNSGGGSANGIVVSSDNCLISDNLVNERATGIWVQAGAADNQLVGNRINNNTTSLLDQGTATYFGRRFYTVSTLLTPTGTSFNGDFVIPTGLFSNKPQTAFCNCQDQDAVGFYEFDSPSSTATNARIRLVKLDGSAFSGAASRFSVLMYE